MVILLFVLTISIVESRIYKIKSNKYYEEEGLTDLLSDFT